MSAASLTENGESQAEQLVVGATLPPSGIDRIYVHVQREHKVLCTSVPPVLQNLSAPEWKDGKYLKDSFTKPSSGRSSKRQKTHYQFPYCLLAFGPAATSLRERLIVINWWLNLSKKDQKDIKENVIRRRFSRPNVSSDLFLRADPNDPRAIGSADTQELREKYAATTRAHQILEGGGKRKKVDDPPRANAQLRDVAVRVPEANALSQMQTAIHRSRITNENSDTVQARYEPVFTTVSTAHTPQKRGRASNEVRSVANVNHFGRDRAGLVRNLQPLAQAIRDNKENIDLDTLDGEALMKCIENAANHSVHYCGGDGDDEWPAIQFLERRSRRSKDNVSRTETIAETIRNNETSDADTSQETTHTLSSMDDWDLADY